jgi:hypothetical protein
MLGPFRLLFALGLVGAAVGIFFGAKGLMTAKDAVDSVNRTGGDRASLFHADRLDSALGKVRAKVGDDGQLLALNIYPGYLQVDASTGSEDKGRSFRIQENGKVDELPLTLNGHGRLRDNVFPLARLDAATVQRLAEQVAAKEHGDLDDVTHVIATIQPDSGKPGLNVYLKNQRYWRAGLDGRGLSNPDHQAREALDDAGKAVAGATQQAGGASDLAACLQKAGTDVAKVSACTK